VLVPQPHGGALLRSGPAANRSSIRAIRKRGLALLAEGSEQAARVLVAALDSPDERVRVIAAQQIMDRVHGRPGERPQGDDDQEEAGEIDLSDLSHEELALLYKLARSGRLGRRLQAPAVIEAGTIEGDATVLLPEDG
jgi:hypothetical protein